MIKFVIGFTIVVYTIFCYLFMLAFILVDKTTEKNPFIGALVLCLTAPLSCPIIIATSFGALCGQLANKKNEQRGTKTTA